MKKFFFILVLISSMSFAAETKSEIIQTIQTSFKKVQTIKTNFTQTVRSARFGEKTSQGILLLERPGKMIWNYSNPKDRVFAANGDFITLYDPEEKQALISPQPKGSDLPAGFSFLMGNVDFQTYFDVEISKDEKNSKGHREVSLLCKPKKDNVEFKTMELTFEWVPEPMIVASKTKDMLDSENEIRFDHTKINTKLAASDFKAKFPKGTPIVSVDSINP